MIDPERVRSPRCNSFPVGYDVPVVAVEVDDIFAI